MEYTILSHYAISDLISDVQSHINEGWEPQGGVTGASWADSWDMKQFRFLQAMIRHTKPQTLFSAVWPERSEVTSRV